MFLSDFYYRVLMPVGVLNEVVDRDRMLICSIASYYACSRAWIIITQYSGYVTNNNASTLEHSAESQR